MVPCETEFPFSFCLLRDQRFQFVEKFPPRSEIQFNSEYYLNVDHLFVKTNTLRKLLSADIHVSPQSLRHVYALSTYPLFEGGVPQVSSLPSGWLPFHGDNNKFAIFAVMRKCSEVCKTTSSLIVSRWHCSVQEHIFMSPPSPPSQAISVVYINCLLVSATYTV